MKNGQGLRLGPAGEEGELRGAVGETLALRVGEETLGKTGVEGGHGDVRGGDGEKRAPGAAADFKKSAATFFDAAGAVRRGIAGEEFVEARGEIDLPVGAQPLGLGGGKRGKLHGERRRGGHESVHFLDPAGAFLRETIVGGDVGFEVEDRGAVDEVALAEDETTALDRDELHRGEAEGIGPVG